MNPEEADRWATGAATYIHIPFCSAICPYCDFAVVAGQDEMAARYVDAVCLEIDQAEPWRPLDSVYFGGGTPSHVDPRLLARILGTLADKHGLAGGAEVSLEANPEDFSVDRAAELREIGFNRVSFGAQSFDGDVLTSLGRRHDGSQIARSMEAARAAGFHNLSIDLIYGTPGETDSSWRETMERAIALEPSHISCYALTVERGTPLGNAVRNGGAAPDPDVQADRHAMADTLLSAAGLARHEVSNWSKPGRECRYNLTVWAQGEYEAYGNGAHGFRNDLRYRNHRRLDAYIDRIESGSSPRAGHDRLEGWDLELDRLFVGLRRAVGVASGAGTDALLVSDEGRNLMDAGVIKEITGRLVVTRPLLTDAVHRAVLGLPAPGSPRAGDAGSLVGHGGSIVRAENNA
jgi:oxygen-independent coproporphyrinogen-3 oxidase